MEVRPIILYSYALSVTKSTCYFTIDIHQKTRYEGSDGIHPDTLLVHRPSDDPAFSALFDQIEGRYDRSFLRRFFSFVSRSCGVEPDDVDEAVLAGFAQAVLVAGVDRPKQVVRDAVRTLEPPRGNC